MDMRFQIELDEFEKRIPKEKREKLAKFFWNSITGWTDTATQLQELYFGSCSMCGRCCRNCVTEFSVDELKAMIKASGQNPTSFVKENTHLLDEGVNRLKAPCRLLVENKCSVYDVRPITCKLFPLCFPFSISDIEGCDLAKAIYIDLSNLTELEVEPFLNEWERDEELKELATELNELMPEELKGPNFLHKMLDDLSWETIPESYGRESDGGKRDQISAQSLPVYFRTLIAKKRSEVKSR